MGSCCSCCSSSDDGDNAREMELQAQKSRKALSISRGMSAPDITQISANCVTGKGLALAGVSIEQDAAYWEWHIRIGTKDTLENILFGVTTKKDSSFYKEAQEDTEPPEEGAPSQVNGTQYMRRVAVDNGDVIGVAVQQSDLPMVQFTLNGEQLHISAINKFRGTVYPSVFLPENTNDLKAEVHLVTNEHEFRQKSPGDRFLPLIVARSVV